MQTHRRWTIGRLSGAGFGLLIVATLASAQDRAGHAPLPRFHQVSEKLYRGAQPRAEGIRRLAEIGIDTIINLRGAGDRTRSDEREARALGMDYFNVPLPTWGRPDDGRVLRVLAIISAQESGRVFIHCKDGVDRTGTITAVYRISREGWEPGVALAEAERRGMRKIQFWMRDYVEDFGRAPGPGAEGSSRQHGFDEDLGDRIGTGVRIAEEKTFRARKIGARVIRRAPGAVGGHLLGGIF